MPPTPPPTKSGTRKPSERRLSEVAKHLVVPEGIVSTGWPAVCRTCTDKMGVEFDDWQHGAGRVILAKRADGTLAAMVDGVGLSLPRQVGKTYLVGALIFALCVNTPGLLVIWSAHHARTHGETFLAMQAFAGRAKVQAHVKQVFTGSGDEEIRFHNGSRVLFGARERGFGRGIPGVDVLIFDEAQILSDKALSNILATMNTSRFGLALYIGTPPKPEDMSESFERMRADALAGRLTDGAWVEFGADKDARADDRAQWRKANPSYPLRTPVQSILRLQRKLTAADFLREGLGVWDDKTGTVGIPLDVWLKLADPAAERGTKPAFGVAVAPDRSWAAIGVAWRRPDGAVQVMLADYRPDATWIEGRLAELRLKWSEKVATDQAARGMVDKADHTNAPDQAQADNALYDAVLEGKVRHGNEPALNVAVRNAKWRAQGNSRVFDRKTDKDISPLAAVSLAFAALAAAPANAGKGRVIGFT